MAYTSKNPQFSTEILTNQGSTTISNTPSGTNRLINRNGVIYVQDSSGSETPAGSGAGELNVVQSSSNTASGWTASGAGITVATTTTGSDLPLSSIITTAIKFTPVSGTDYAYVRWTMPAALKSTKLKIQWDQRALSGYVTGDLKVDLYVNSASNYGGSYTRQALSTDSSGVSPIPLQTGRYFTSWDSDTSDYYELRIVRTAGTTALNLASLIIGPGIQPQGSTVRYLGNPGFTVSAGFGTITNSSFQAWQDGPVMRVLASFQCGTVAGSRATINFPSGYNVDTSAISSANDSVLGTWFRSTSAGAAVYSSTSGVVYYSVSLADTGKVCLATATAGSQDGKFSADNASSILSTSDRVILEFFVPISQAAGTGQVYLGTTDVEYASASTGTWDAAATATDSLYGPGGSPITGSLTAARAKVVRFLAPIAPTDEILVQFLLNGTVDQWINAAVSAANFLNAPTVPTGARITETTATDVTVTFAQYASPGTVYDSTVGAVNWASAVFSAWRVVKRRAGVPVGFGLAQANSNGLMPASSGRYTAGLTVGWSFSGGGSPTMLFQRSYVYRTVDGIWKIKFDIKFSVSGASAGYIGTLTIAQLTFKNESNGEQAVNMIIQDNQQAFNAYTNPGASTITWFATANLSNGNYHVYGDVELQSQPTGLS